MRSLTWQNPSSNLVLPDDEIHLWRVDLNFSNQYIEQLEATLSEDEKQRANRFKFAHHKKHFIAARGILRQLLGRYIQSPGEKIDFIYNSRGKPELSSCFSDYNLKFNISHSQSLALYSFNYEKKIGIDLEYLRDNIDYKTLAQRFFCDREFKLINNCAMEQQQQRFYQLWTAKEAYLKATGEGLSGGLENLEIKLNREGHIYLHSIKNQEKLAQCWSLYNFIPENNFIATVACFGKKKNLKAINYKL